MQEEMRKNTLGSLVENEKKGTAFIVASNLYIPCIASISVLRSELGSWGRTLALLAAMFALAMGMACAVYHIAVFV